MERTLESEPLDLQFYLLSFFFKGVGGGCWHAPMCGEARGQPVWLALYFYCVILGTELTSQRQASPEPAG